MNRPLQEPAPRASATSTGNGPHDRLPQLSKGVSSETARCRLRYYSRFEKVRVGQAIAGGVVKARCRRKVRAPSDKAPGNAWRT